MGVKERHEREREATARSILDAARDLFVTHGYQHVSIRKIAERIEYSPASIYGYFPSKDDIFFALAEEGFHMLVSSVDPTTAAGPPAQPLDEVRAMLWHYYRFSREHPEYFALMFLDRFVPRISRDWERFGFIADMKQRVASRIQRAVDAGLFPADTHPQRIFRILLTAVHGAATMRLCDRLAPGEDADALARDTIEAALQGLRSGIVFTSTLSSCPELELPGAIEPKDSSS